MRPSNVAALAPLLLALGCGDFKDMLALSNTLHEHYHAPASVMLRNGNHLVITFENDSLESLKLDSAGVEAFAHDVAAFTKSHYPRAASIEDIDVVFTTESSTGPLTLTRTTAPHRYRIAELP